MPTRNGSRIDTDGAGDDALYGGDGDDARAGGAGTNTLDGEAGHDTFDRGAAHLGDDTLDGSRACPRRPRRPGEGNIGLSVAPATRVNCELRTCAGKVSQVGFVLTVRRGPTGIRRLGRAGAVHSVTRVSGAPVAGLAGGGIRLEK
jgi:Ca2+-binding RTX toxin-like protein